nr:uncharacterized protein LOC129156244 [Nothobranchius furzeri]
MAAGRKDLQWWSVLKRNTCGGQLEQRGRPSVQRKSSVRRMETPPPGGAPNMAEIRSGYHRSLRFMGKRPLSTLLLPDRCGHASGSRRIGSPVAESAAVRVSSSQSDFLHSNKSKRTGPVFDLGGSIVAIQAVGDRNNPDALGRTVAPACPQGSPVPSQGRDLSPSPRPLVSVGLARERWNLSVAGLPPSVIDTIQNAPSIRSLYSCKWRVFEGWCEEKLVIPFQCSVGDVLCFLQSLMDKGKAFSTIKVYLAAISACHVGFGDKPVGQHPLVSRFMKGARRKLPVFRPLVPLWDLSLVLEALCHHPFEPVDGAGLKFLSLKTALLLALTTAKRVSDLQAWSVSPSCLRWAPGYTKVCLRPNPAFVPKVMESSYSCSPVELLAFHPPPFSSAEEQKLNCLCPVRALMAYMDRTPGLRKSDQLFVSWATAHKGKPVSRQRLAHWIVEAISLSYKCKGAEPPLGVRAHSTRSMATSWALFRGESVQDICAAASWTTPLTFVRFYRLDVSQPLLAHSVLEAGCTASA